MRQAAHQTIGSILGLQPRDKAAMLVVNRKKLFSKNFHENRVKFLEERNAIVPDHQHGRRDVTCKPVPWIYFVVHYSK